jgi:hypothetical protein
MDKSSDRTIATLSSFLRGELAAVESYEQALRKLSGLGVAWQLKECQRSHLDRANKLRSRIRALGGNPDEVSPTSGAFARAPQGGARRLGSKAALSALEEGENHGVRKYLHDLGEEGALDPYARAFVERELLPEQQRTHDLLSMVRQMLN